jgi:hypothetical protein
LVIVAICFYLSFFVSAIDLTNENRGKTPKSGNLLASAKTFGNAALGHSS